MTLSNVSRSTLGLALLVATVTLAAVGSPVWAQSAPDPAFIVAVEYDGSAVVSVRSQFDLTTAAERQAFLSLEDDDAAKADAEARFLARMQSVAGEAENATGRDMTVTDPVIELTRTADNETGVITLSVTWTGLAASSGDRLVVTEPFASGFTPERPFILRAPDGYTIGSASPEPTSTSDGSAVWRDGTNLTGFSVELHPAGTPTEPETTAGGPETTRSGGQPGFGMLVAVVALLSIAGVRAVRRTARSDG